MARHERKGTATAPPPSLPPGSGCHRTWHSQRNALPQCLPLPPVSPFPCFASLPCSPSFPLLFSLSSPVHPPLFHPFLPLSPSYPIHLPLSLIHLGLSFLQSVFSCSPFPPLPFVLPPPISFPLFLPPLLTSSTSLFSYLTTPIPPPHPNPPSLLPTLLLSTIHLPPSPPSSLPFSPTLPTFSLHFANTFGPVYSVFLTSHHHNILVFLYFFLNLAD